MPLHYLICLGKVPINQHNAKQYYPTRQVRKLRPRKRHKLGVGDLGS